MPSITFDLETVTPLFLSGADQTIAELRPPAFRGALRYWFRAVAGTYCSNIPQLKEIESALLGNTQGVSNIVLRLAKIPDRFENRVINLNRQGLNYLWFSTKAQRRMAIGFDEPIQFSLTLSTRPHPKKTKQQQKNLLIAANAFWLAVNLGGFGSRERRGAGSLRVLKTQYQGFDDNFVKGLPRFDIKFKTDQIPIFFKGELEKIQRRFIQLLNLDLSIFDDIKLSDIEVFRFPSNNSKIYRISNPYSSWEDALDDIGQQYSQYRSNKPIRERMAFGLPLKGNNARRPSPLRIKIVRSIDNYFCFLIRNYAAFPDSSGIVQLSQFQIIDDFINSCDGVEEVF